MRATFHKDSFRHSTFGMEGFIYAIFTFQNKENRLKRGPLKDCKGNYIHEMSV
jgi:hypothetical protein